MIETRCKDVYGNNLEFDLETAVIEQSNIVMLGILSKEKVMDLIIFRLAYGNGRVALITYDTYIYLKNRMFLDREVL